MRRDGLLHRETTDPIHLPRTQSVRDTPTDIARLLGGERHAAFATPGP
jgi:hypothetical protein